MRTENQWCRQKKFLIQVSLLKADYNAKNTEIEGKIHSITDLATTAALTAVENKIPDVSNLVKKKKIMMQKTSDIGSKYFIMADYNKFTSQTLDAKIKQIYIVDKSATAGFKDNFD